MSLDVKGNFGFEINWFTKALSFISKNKLFLKDKEEAQYILGIGKTKVEALEKWLLSAELTVRCKEGKKLVTYLSPLGETIRQFDSNFYDYNTLALILYHLSKGPKKQGSELIYWYMNKFNFQEFTREQLKQALTNDYPNLKDRSIENITQALLQVFRLTPLGNDFRLLIEEKKGHFRKEEPPERYIHPLIFAYAIIDWAKERNEWVLPIEYIKKGECLPGKSFNFSGKRVDKYLNTIHENYPQIINISRDAGLNKVIIQAKEPLEILKKYYQQAR